MNFHSFSLMHGKKIFLLILFMGFSFCFAQNTKKQSDVSIKNKLESRQPQDMSVPPPPVNSFPAQYPKGNRAFLMLVEKNLNKEALKAQSKKLTTKIMIKVDDEGNVINISTYGANDLFNKEVETAAKKAVGTTKWTAGKNSQGEKVIDIVRLPFVISQ
ncbi:hypothetical protein KRE47_17460 [Elizabethkingia meningoseptica]|uniref:hypothetical protein n=1 Tax=Elizabethkingia meningoseptica TaxID=238 RepID=UPI0022F19831|nr:hypothetical protein [Elizabethkingia meningoseptica]EJK5330776.1 hypothetical protein [Elizabethkingia meningoseptica]MDE5469566.1 hypothetical protein [Elizabethkingia meningoseptica]MDE5476485.1 hypothetical protein [Elizabethkingia meningoseptica]MDE5480169.1 hypothetical protein [Elizabethkingia meningoseptica]MDE5487235.1 hypothetical protein [Elizabethkingia meningoseptica]